MKPFFFALVIFTMMTYLFTSMLINRFNPLEWPIELQIIQPVLSAAGAFFFWLLVTRDERPIR